MADDLEILRKIPDTGYRETVPTINPEEFVKVVQSRRSVRVYDTTKTIPDDIVEKCLDLALDAPNSSNLQPWEFYWVKSPEKLKKLQELCLSQSAARTAPTIIVAIARMDTWDRNRKMMIDFFNKSEKKVPRGAYLYYEKIAKLSYTLGFLNYFGIIKKIVKAYKHLRGELMGSAPTSYSDLRVWAHKSTALACENLMLAFRAYGYDTCPMEGLDAEMVKKLLDIKSCRADVCMAVSAGVRAPNGIFAPRLRFDRNLFVKTI